MPIPVFYDPATNEPVINEAIIENIAKVRQNQCVDALALMGST